MRRAGILVSTLKNFIFMIRNTYGSFSDFLFCRGVYRKICLLVEVIRKRRLPVTRDKPCLLFTSEPIGPVVSADQSTRLPVNCHW